MAEKKAATSAPKSDNEILNFIYNNYGGLAAYLTIPELRSLLFRAAKENWSGTRLEAGVKRTDWWKKTNQQQQQWLALSPAQQNLAVQQAAAQIASTLRDYYGPDHANTQGWTLGSTQVQAWAKDIASGKTDFNVWAYGQQMGAEKITGTPAWNKLIQEKKAAGATVNDIENLAGQLLDTAANKYLISLDATSANQWANQIVMGTASEQDFVDWARQTSASMFPTFGKQILSGVDTASLLSPYKNLAEEELERPIDWKDTLLQEPLSGQNPVTLSAYRTMLRSAPEWRSTSRASDMAADFALRLGETFGQVKM